MSDDIWRWTATRIATAIRDRDISAREALESCLGRMAAVNTKLNAVTVDLSKSAREAADRADAAVARGDELGALEIELAPLGCHALVLVGQLVLTLRELGRGRRKAFRGLLGLGLAERQVVLVRESPLLSLELMLECIP